MDTVKTAVEQMNTVPQEFWFAASLILTSVLIWIFKYYLNKMDKQSDEFRLSIQDLVTMVKLHEKDIDRHSKRLDDHEGKIQDLQVKRSGSRRQ